MLPNKGLNFVIPPKKTEHLNFLLPFELLFPDIKPNRESSVDLTSAKASLQDTAFISYSAFNKDSSNLSKDEFYSMCKLKIENNLVIRKTDKGNTIVILDKDCYLKLVEALLTDFYKFKNIPLAPDKDLNYIINFEKRVTDLLQKRKNKITISEETNNKLRPVGSKAGKLYRSAKVHQPFINGLPLLRPILSEFGTPNIQTSKIFSSPSV